ncbi:FAD-dependent monooxygenase [Actinomadura sp. CNU-125]|uniref:FAD-dependent monooxygenase n=1 Tax=Actinomadura sp. CNU-125 TaxID=1904961 RepID=UPI000AC4C37E|nr:FAD-dependent monooxygenase [Actinomadura sp. CNU-125]
MTRSGAVTFDVVIVGGGPVGLVTALLLARFGVSSAVLEAADGRAAAGSRAICFQRDVLDVFGRVGCGDALVARGVTWTTGRTYYRGTELFSVSFPEPDEGATPPWINISQAEVERRLCGLVAAEPLIDLRYGHRVVGLEQDGGGVEAIVDGRGRVRAAYAVGADGAHSDVRRLLGIGFPGRSFADRFLICDVRAELPFPRERRFHFDPVWNPGRQVLVHPCPDSVWRIDQQVPDGFDLDAERASGALDARIRRIVGDVPYEIVWTTAYRFHQRCAETFRAGRAFLAGDAAHVFAPFGARGLNSGVQDAENLAWKLAFVLRHGAPGRLLGSYDAERRAAALENLRVTGRTMEFLVPRTPEQRARRVAALERALHDPDARAEIDSGRLAEPYRYADSPLTTPSGPSGPFLPGALCPDVRAPWAANRCGCGGCSARAWCC